MLFWLCALAVFAVDRLTKLLVITELSLGQSVPVIPGILHITHVRNPGGAFGLLPQGQLFFTTVTLFVFIAVITYHFVRRPDGLLLNVALGLVLGGSAGNLVDRLTVGRVIDWVDFRIFPVFNVADSALVVGLGLISLQILWPAQPSPTDREQNTASDSDD